MEKEKRLLKEKVKDEVFEDINYKELRKKIRNWFFNKE